MAIDPRQLMALVHAAPMDGGEPSQGFAAEPIEPVKPAGEPEPQTIEADPMSAGSRASPEQVGRLLVVGYMEIPSMASGFVCGACEFYRDDETTCGAERIDAPVSPTSGCCNEFQPLDGVVFPAMSESAPSAPNA